MRTLKKWPLLYRHYDVLCGKPHQSRVKMLTSGISVNTVAADIRGDTDWHVKEFCKMFPSAVPAEVRMAIAFNKTCPPKL